jgi:hypothetical protein
METIKRGSWVPACLPGVWWFFFMVFLVFVTDGGIVKQQKEGRV